MQKYNAPAIAILLVLSATISAQETKSFVVLPASAALKVCHFCSREGLPRVAGSWRPTTAKIELLESRLMDVSRLVSTGEVNGVRISQPAHYHRQYVPVLLGKQQLIYVNAFSDSPPSTWRTGFVDMCDADAWGVLYEPRTGHFSDLRINSALPPPPPIGS